MKRIITILLVAIALGFSQQASAQAWSKESKVLTLGLGGSAYYQFLPGYARTDVFGRTVTSSYWNVNGMFLFQGEFGIHKYVGLGFVTGIGGSAGLGTAYGAGSASVTAPIGMQANFHFYQLIADKVSKDIHADKLDVYAGVNVGSGVGYNFSIDNVTVPVWGGLQVGARYWFTDKVAVYGEVSPYTGKSFINAGVAFNL